MPTLSAQVRFQANSGKPASNIVKKVGVSLLAGLALTGGATAGVTHAAQNLPLCEHSTSSVAWERGPCVSSDFSNLFDGAYRGARGLLHRGQAIDDLASPGNRILKPDRPRAPNAADGSLTVVSWNLHHSTGPSSEGARPQLGSILETLNRQDAEVHLLQEVNPWDAQQIVDQTGMTGYYSQTTPRQGNMILVAPDLQVTGNHRQTLNHDIPTGDTERAEAVVDLGSGLEPRAAQAIRLQTPEGSLVVFNTHLSTRSATADARHREGETFNSFVEALVDSGDHVVGGGDLNMRRDGQVLREFESQGYQIGGATIDWLVARGADLKGLAHGDIHTAQGLRISDHPLVRGELELS